MKKILLVVLLVGIAGVAGVVRSHSKADGNGWRLDLNGDPQSAAIVRDEIRKNFELAAGARVEVSGINGWVKIETSDTRTADVYIERTGASQEVLNRRKITIENTSAGLTIRGDKDEDAGFFSRVFGSRPTEHVTLKLPQQISLVARGVNGAVTTGEIDGSVEVHGINGKVDIAQAGSAEFNGINGNITVGLKQLEKGLDLHGINGNIELQLSDSLNADLDAHGMNGQVISDLPNVTVDKNNHGNYSAQIGKGGTSISASGINGNIRLTRMLSVATATADAKRAS